MPRVRILGIIALAVIALVGVWVSQREASAGPLATTRSKNCNAPTRITKTDQYPDRSTYVATQVAALPEGACIQLPDGLFAVTESIRPKSGQTIIGGAGTTMSMTHPRLDGFILENVNNVSIENITLQGGRLRQPGNAEYNYGATRGYGIGIRMTNVGRVTVTGSTIDDFMTGIDCRLGCNDLLISHNRVLVREGNLAGDADWTCNNSLSRPSDSEICVFETMAGQRVEQVAGAAPIWPQTLAAFCPYITATSSYEDCSARVGAVVTSTRVNPATIPNVSTLPMLWRRPSPNPSNGSPFFGVKGALINIDGERNVVEPYQRGVEKPQAERIRITNNILRGSDRTCDDQAGIRPTRWPVPPADRTHAKRGVLITAVRDLQIDNNTLSCLYFSGIALAEAQQVRILNNTLRYLERSIYLFHSNDSVEIVGNTIEDSIGGAATSAAAVEIARYNNRVLMTSNTLKRVLGFGIRILTPSITTAAEERLGASTISDNTIEMAIEHRTANVPLTIQNGNGVTVRRNKLSNGLYGIEFRRDCGVSGGKNTYTANSFRALESAAFHREECRVQGRRLISQGDVQSGNSKENSKILLSRNSNEFLLQRILTPATTAQAFDWEKVDQF